MDSKIEAVKLSVSGVFAAAVSMSGVNNKWIIILIVFMLADCLFGWIKSLKTHTFVANKAKWGFVGKIVELGVVCLLGLMDWAFDINGLLSNVGVMYYTIVEMASIVENINEGGLADLPAGLAESLVKIKYSAGKELIKKLRASILAILNIEDGKDKQ